MQAEVDWAALSRPSAVAFFTRGQLPSGWQFAAALSLCEAIRLPEDARASPTLPNSCGFWIARHADCPALIGQLFPNARKSGAKLIVFGEMRWEEQARALEGGAWVLPEPEDPLAFLRWLRAYSDDRGPQLAAPTLTLNATLRTALVDGIKVPLQPREAALLLLLREGGSDGVTPNDLCQRLFADALPRHRRLLSQHMHSLRAKLGPLAEYITFSRESGYRCMLRVRLVDVSL